MTLFNLLIIDDEPIVREGLKKFVQWDKLGFCVIGDVGTALEALELLEIERIDVIVTDIMMPEMNGLELIKCIRKMDSQVKSVILSGYGDFKYAQQALRLGAFDFLTKPVVFEELKKVFLKLAESLHTERRKRNKDEEYAEVIREMLLNNVAKGLLQDKQEIAAKFQENEIGTDGLPIVVLTIRIQISSQELFSMNSWKHMLSELLFQIGRPFPFISDIHEISLLLYPNHVSRFKDELRQALIELKPFANCAYAIGIGKMYDSIYSIADSYKEACKALDFECAEAGNGVRYFEDISEIRSHTFSLSEEMKTKILLHLTQYEEQKILSFIDFIFTDNQLFSITAMQEATVEIMILIKQHIKHYGSDRASDNAGMDLLGLFEHKETVALKQYIVEFVRTATAFVRNNRESSSGAIIETAKKYIKEHFNEDIQLYQLAEILYVHPVYISKLFKEKTGENFIDYLTRMRILKAKELLKNMRFKIYEVAEMVGYNNSKYFSSSFKKIVGITPKEYRSEHEIG